MSRRLAMLAAVAALAGGSLPAGADELASVRDKVTTAMTAAKSFVVTTSASTGFAVTMTYVAPDRFHSTLAYNGTERDVVVVGPIAYVSSDGVTYRKVDTPAEVIAVQQQLRNVPVDQVLPDKPAAGTVYGQFATVSAGLQRDQHLTCNYDKKTYRIVSCANAETTVSFSRYDDPANAVAIPTRVATPAPAATPKPGA